MSSPTGSTGYSFSAGGPILDPHSRNLVVTPIAGYLSAIRSIVVSPAQVVRCRVVDAHEALVSIDGREDHRDPGRRRRRGAGAGTADPVRRAARDPAVLGPAADEGPAAAVVTMPETGPGDAGRLLELAVTDLALIDRLRLTLEPGLNVLTGETGAGKSLLIDALGLATGARADTTLVRHGADTRARGGAVRPGAGAAHRRPRGGRERPVHGARRRRDRDGRPARRDDRAADRDPRPARPAAAAGRGLAA